MNVDRIARNVSASLAEKEVERLLRVILKGTPFAGKTHAVGGYVRDEYMGLEAKDLDVVVEMDGGSNKLTNIIHQMYPKATSTPRQMGASYPIWQITFKDDVEVSDDTFQTKGAVIEFADTMKEGFPDENSRQRTTMSGTLKDDIERRDFTANMLLKDLSTGEIVDMTGTSKSDIEKGILRGHPGVSLDKIFSDDPLRMIRLIRFQAKYGWKIPLSVLKTVKRNAQRIKIVSSERIMGELEKVMKMGKLGQAIRIMKATGLLQYIFPEIEAMRGVKQSPVHHAEGDVFTHTVKVLKNAKPGVESQLAALMHDVGKPATQKFVDDKIKFLGHEQISGEIARAMMKRLKFDNKTTDKVVRVVENHMRPHALVRGGGPKAIRKFIREVGEELVDAVVDLAEADDLGRIPHNLDKVPEFRRIVEEVRNAPIQVSKNPVLNGKEIMSILGIEKGDRSRLPEIGEAGKFLLELADDYAADGKELTKRDAEKALNSRRGVIRRSKETL